MKQCYQALGSIFDHQMTKPELLGVSLRIHLRTIKPIKFTEGAPKSSKSSACKNRLIAVRPGEIVHKPEIRWKGFRY